MLKGRKKTRLGPVKSQRSLFHAVTIQPSDDFMCSEVERLLGERYLSEDAPSLPLAECSQPSACRCVYQHFDDRRTNVRRESDMGLPQREVQPEARRGTGRRITDD